MCTDALFSYYLLEEQSTTAGVQGSTADGSLPGRHVAFEMRPPLPVDNSPDEHWENVSDSDEGEHFDFSGLDTP